MNQKTFFIKTFGCQMNIRDTEIMAQTLAEDGYIESSLIDDASLIILNTCAIRAKAEQKVYSLLGSLRKHKKANPGMQICVAGCVAQQEAARLIERMPHVDLVIGTQHIYDLPQLLRNTKNKHTATGLLDKYDIPRYLPVLKGMTGFSPQEPDFKFSRFVTIMQGCNNFCTYCVVPYTRGREASRQVEDILDEVKIHIDSGVSEIVLLGQNVNSYGQSNSVTSDGAPYSFASLLRDVSKIDGLKRLRFTTSNPKDLSDDLIKCFEDIPNLCSQFHLPVQSGSDSILKSMNRKYTIENYLDKVEKLIAARPGIAISTDIIVGFPGETEKNFNRTMQLLEKVRYHGSFSFKYSDRPGTKASKMLPKIDEKEKSRRLQIFQKRQDEISLERNSDFIGKVFKILVEKSDNNGISGRSETNHIVHLENGSIRPKKGDYVNAKIVFAGQHSLKAEMLQE